MSLHNEGSRNLFVVQGKSLKAKNELHLVEYNPYLGGIATHQMFTSEYFLHRVAEDREQGGSLLIAARQSDKDYFGVGKFGVDDLREVSNREEIHKVSKDASLNKSVLKPSLFSEIHLRIRE